MGDYYYGVSRMKEITIVFLVFMLASYIVVSVAPKHLENVERARIQQHDRDLTWENEEWIQTLREKSLLVEN